MSYDSGAHDQSARLVETVAFVHRPAHAHGILQATLSGDGIGTSRVYHDRLDALPLSVLQDIPTHLNGSRLELVGGEHGRRRTRSLRRNEGQVRELGVRGLDTDVSSRDIEALRIGSGRRDVFLFGGRNRHVQRGGIIAHLALHHPGEGGHSGWLNGGGHEGFCQAEAIVRELYIIKKSWIVVQAELGDSMDIVPPYLS